ncbi:hypothetical protein K439DRAFT_1337973, partial [Ramaria rubella]
MEIFEERTQQRKGSLAKGGTPSNIILYVGDGKIYTSSRTLEANIMELTCTWDIAHEWLSSAGLSPDFNKWELAHYSCRRDVFSNEPSLWLPGKDDLPVEVKAERVIKWLGIYFDRKLTFNEHVKRMAGRAEKTINGLSMLANTVRGLAQHHVQTLHITCILPQLTYGSLVWWTGKKSCLALADTTQNK